MIHLDPRHKLTQEFLALYQELELAQQNGGRERKVG
jgi:chromosome partitioning protein